MWSSAPPSPVPLHQNVVVVGFYCCIPRWVLLSLAPRQMIDSNGSYSPEQTALRNSWSAGCQFDRRKQHSCPLRLLGRATRLMHRRYSPRRPSPPGIFSSVAFLRRIEYLCVGLPSRALRTARRRYPPITFECDARELDGSKWTTDFRENAGNLSLLRPKERGYDTTGFWIGPIVFWTLAW